MKKGGAISERILNIIFAPDISTQIVIEYNGWIQK